MKRDGWLPKLTKLKRVKVKAAKRGGWLPKLTKQVDEARRKLSARWRG